MEAIEYARANRGRFLDELDEFLRLPSISTQVAHQPDIQRTAAWVCEQLRAAGFPCAQVMPTAGHPVVYGEWPAARANAPTLLMYGHYDVQPPDPLEEWHTPPFEPTVIGDDIFARGASDDKSQMYAQIKAVEALGRTAGRPPINIKCLFEGEEEIGSRNLEPFIVEHTGLLAADLALISDTHILGPDMPSIVYALRGIAYIEVEVNGPNHDLHSGTYGGAVNNPINVLCRLIAQLQDDQGRILIPGFYDHVRELDAEEHLELAKIPFDYQAWLAQAGVEQDWGERAYTIVERTTARPTLDVNGIWGGYTQPGVKTVLPAKARAKISMRLVPDQCPNEIIRLTEDYLRQIAPPSVKVEVRGLHTGEGAIVRRDSPAMQAAFRAYAESFGRPPIWVREGGSLPVVASFQRALGIETVLMGFGLPDDRLHAPNEKFHLPNLYRGIEALIWFLNLLGNAETPIHGSAPDAR